MGKAGLSGQRWAAQLGLGAILARRRPGRSGFRVQGACGGQLRGAPRSPVEDEGCKGVAGWRGRARGNLQGAAQGAAQGGPPEVQAQHLLGQVRLQCCIACQQHALHHKLRGPFTCSCLPLIEGHALEGASIVWSLQDTLWGQFGVCNVPTTQSISVSSNQKSYHARALWLLSCV